MSAMPSLLLVEDDAAIRTALQLALTRQGHQVAVAASGEEALATYKTVRPDLIVLDVMLPGVDGFEVCRQIRRTEQLPIILLTAPQRRHRRGRRPGVRRGRLRRETSPAARPGRPHPRGPAPRRT